MTRRTGRRRKASGRTVNRLDDVVGQRLRRGDVNVKFQLIVHRGWNLNGRENSFEGIREIISLTDKCMIEIDILTTRDDVAILFHDIT